LTGYNAFVIMLAYPLVNDCRIFGAAGGYEKDPDQEGNLHRLRAVPGVLRYPALQL
jgi:hypothetical protein